MPDPDKQQTGSWTPPEPDRRHFLKCAATAACGGLAVLTPAAASLVVYLDPLFKQNESGQFVKIVNLNGLPADGSPRKFSVVTSKRDAWTQFSAVPVGAVYLRRVSDRQVLALNAICPHAGCFVDHRPGGDGFLCPCHNSSFALDGSINDPKSPSPRRMDELATEVRENGEVWVKFQNFKPGQEEKTPIA